VICRCSPSGCARRGGARPDAGRAPAVARRRSQPPALVALRGQQGEPCPRACRPPQADGHECQRAAQPADPAQAAANCAPCRPAGRAGRAGFQPGPNPPRAARPTAAFQSRPYSQLVVPTAAPALSCDSTLSETKPGSVRRTRAGARWRWRVLAFARHTCPAWPVRLRFASAGRLKPPEKTQTMHFRHHTPWKPVSGPRRDACCPAAMTPKKAPHDEPPHVRPGDRPEPWRWPIPDPRRVHRRRYRRDNPTASTTSSTRVNSSITHASGTPIWPRSKPCIPPLTNDIRLWKTKSGNANPRRLGVGPAVGFRWMEVTQFHLFPAKCGAAFRRCRSRSLRPSASPCISRNVEISGVELNGERRLTASSAASEKARQLNFEASTERHAALFCSQRPKPAIWRRRPTGRPSNYVLKLQSQFCSTCRGRGVISVTLSALPRSPGSRHLAPPVRRVVGRSERSSASLAEGG